MIEAGMNAKKKVLDFYNQIKAKNNNDGQSASSSSGYGPRSTNTQYQGLPSSNDDDYLLSGEMTALHLSDQDVYSGMQQQRAKNYYDYQPPSAAATQQNQQHQYQSATLGVATVGQAPQVDAQILADEEFARRLARDDELWQQRQQQQQQQQEQQPPTMPPRKSPTNLGSLPAKTSPTVVVTPKSPLEEYDERDNNEQSSRDAKTEPKEDKKDDERVQSYIIGDDDSDDGLVDLDDDDDELAKTDKKATDAQKSEQKK
ncbi:hypothetical protein BC940DRAFT_292002 [Gongronella butleri]|nr:hypothetical protein BC940DRAFT_292002 [Gongronella butleri]